ncbi:MAG: pyridoxal phosphate-dependent aminotransferase [Rhodobacteraceae bacterium]|nr:pyridoxal phosphate-dependent aminotransferase [Paracoccaceae bacterium]
MSFDTLIDRRGSQSTKWDQMENIYGVSADDGLAMWVADMDFPAPDCVLNKLREQVDHGFYGYINHQGEYEAAIQWWMKTRHNWTIDPSWIFTTTGLVNAIGLCLDAFTKPGDGVVLFTPVYHSFAKLINVSGRKVVECPLALDNGRYAMDFDAYDAAMTGSETMLILCSPHNPGGRVWSREELQGVCDFAKRHDLILVSDEIHHDLVYPGNTHIPMANVDRSINDRLVMLTAPSKTFNIAGLHTGHVIIEDPDLRTQFSDRMQSLYVGSNSAGTYATLAAYSPEGAAWADELIAYLDGNRKIFDATIADIPGLSSMPLEATYLCWVDCSGTGMTAKEFIRRVQKDARIAVNLGETFGTGGETYLRFNIATQRARVQEACDRMRAAFADLQ